MRTHSRADYRSASDIASIAVPNSSAAATLIRSRILWTNCQPRDHQQYLRSKHDTSWQDTEVSFSKNRYLQLKEKLCCTGNLKWTTYRRHPSPPFSTSSPLFFSSYRSVRWRSPTNGPQVTLNRLEWIIAFWKLL